MLHVHGAFRFASPSSAHTDQPSDTGLFQFAPESLTASSDIVCVHQVIALANKADALRLYRRARTYQWILWALFVIMAVVTAYAVQTVHWLCVIPIGVASLICAPYILRLPDGVLVDDEDNILLANTGHLKVKDSELYMLVD